VYANSTVAQVDALQIEYSAFCLDYEKNGLIDTANELGVKVIAFSPLGAGFLTGKYKDRKQFEGDLRSDAGRFSAENLDGNLKLVDALEKIAEKKGCTPAQLALAWVAAQGAIPIPGTKSASRLEENFGATEVMITDAELKEIRSILDSIPVVGGR
jgi:aryl-alcohol dehydrogenase-like predicted oxidoreductase